MREAGTDEGPAHTGPTLRLLWSAGYLTVAAGFFKAGGS